MTSDTDGRGIGAGGILRRAWLPALCGLLIGGLLYVAAGTRGPSFQTCTNLRISSAPIDQSILGLPAADKPIVNLIGETIGQIEQVRVTKRAVQYLEGKPPTGPVDLLEDIAAKPDPETGFIGLCAKGDTPREAQRVANAVSRAYVDLNRDDQRAKLRAARREVRVLQRARIAALRRQAPGSAGREAIEDAIATARDQLFRLKLAERINIDTVTLATPAELPQGAAGIPAWTIALLGVIFGAGLTSALLAVRELANGRLRSRRELEHVAGVPVLAAIRRGRRLRRRETLERLRRGQSEPLNLLFARLCNVTDFEDRRTLAIVPINGDDAATAGVSWFLSATAAAAGARVLLIETDADRALAAGGGVGGPAGISDVAAGRNQLDEVITQIAADARHVVDVIAPGNPGDPESRAHLSGGESVHSLIAQLRGEYDHVFIATPPAEHADAVPFVRSADGVLLVCRRADTSRETLREACHQLSLIGTPVLGLVAVGFVR